MRCIAFVVALASAPFVPALAAAQSASAGPALGLWAGMTSSTFRGSDAPGPTYKSGFSAGVFGRWSLAQHFALQPEIQYTQKGSDELDTEPQSGTLFALHIRLSYVEVPVLLRASASPVGALTPFAEIGPEVAFKVGCSNDVIGLQRSYTCADLPAAEAVDFGGVAGAGVAFKIAGRATALSVRYDAGAVNAFVGNDAKNRAVTVMLGTSIR